jgi:hypothetical protein
MSSRRSEEMTRTAYRRQHETGEQETRITGVGDRDSRESGGKQQ